LLTVGIPVPPSGRFNDAQRNNHFAQLFFYICVHTIVPEIKQLSMIKP